MTRLVCEPKKLMDIVRRSLVNGSMEASIFVFEPSGLRTMTSKAGTFGGYTSYTPNHFKEYVCDQPVEIKMTKDFLTNLEKLKFGGEELVSLEIDLTNNRLNLQAGGLEYHPTLSNPEVQVLKMGLSERPGIGLLPTSQVQPIHFQASVVAEALGTPQVEKVSYRTVDKSLTLELDLGGPFKRAITPQAVMIPRITSSPEDKTAYTFFVEHMTDILANFVGVVIMTIYEKGIFITQPGKDQSLMYFTATT